jgi:hypothetical protein
LNAFLKIRREETNENHKNFLQAAKTVDLKKANTEAMAKVELACRQEGFKPLNGPNPLPIYLKSFVDIENQVQHIEKLRNERKK